MQVILLAAGYGTRLWPLTGDRAKPAVPFLGRPLIAGLVERLKAGGFDRIVVNTHHQADSIRAALTAHPDVRLSHEPEILGTAGGPARARDAGLLDADEPTLLVNAKLFTDVDFARVMKVHQASGAEVTMVLRENPTRAHFREVLTRDGRVVGFGEGRIPTGPEPQLFTGIHAVSPRVLKQMRAEFSDTIRDVYPPLIGAGRVFAHRADEGRWWEFSTPERYWALHQQAFREGWSTAVGRGVFASKTARIDAGADVSEAIAWDEAQIDARATVRRAIIGAGVHIRAGEAAHDAIVVRRDRVVEIERGEAWGDRVLVPLDVTDVGTLRS